MSWLVALFFWLLLGQNLLTTARRAEADCRHNGIVGREIPAKAANYPNYLFVFGLYTQHIGAVASLRYKIMRDRVQCKVIRLGFFCG
jgi:hypothetical protein